MEVHIHLKVTKCTPHADVPNKFKDKFELQIMYAFMDFINHHTHYKADYNKTEKILTIWVEIETKEQEERFAEVTTPIMFLAQCAGLQLVDADCLGVGETLN